MKSSMLSLIVVVLLSVSIVSAEPLDIILRGPSDNAVVSSYRVEFIYGFSEIPDVKNCSLYLNDELKQTRAMLIQYDNNKIGETLEAGSYDWKIVCVRNDDSVIESVVRHLNMSVELDNNDGYNIVYNNNRMRTYIISPTVGQAPVYLPAMLAGEEIRIKTPKTIYYFDLLKMGGQGDSSFAEIRHRPAGKIVKLTPLVGQEFDFEADGIVDVRLKLLKVERNSKAYLVVEPFPDSSAEPQTPVEEPVVTPVETPVEKPANPDSSSTEKPKTDETATPSTTASEESNMNWLIWVVVVVFLIAIVATLLLSVKKEPKSDEHHAKEHKHEDHHEKFDVIKSTGKKK